MVGKGTPVRCRLISSQQAGAGSGFVGLVVGPLTRPDRGGLLLRCRVSDRKEG